MISEMNKIKKIKKERILRFTFVAYDDKIQNEKYVSAWPCVVSQPMGVIKRRLSGIMGNVFAGERVWKTSRRAFWAQIQG